MGRSRTKTRIRMHRIPHSAFTAVNAAVRVFALSPTREPTMGIKFPAAKRTERIATESAAVASALFKAREAVIKVKNRMQSTFTHFFKKARKLLSPPSKIPSTIVKANSVFKIPDRHGDTNVLTAPRVRFMEDAIVAPAVGAPDRVRSTVVTGREAIKKVLTVFRDVFAMEIQLCKAEKQVRERQR